MKKSSKLFLIATIGVGLISMLNSCKKIDSPTELSNVGAGKDYQNGALITNEGSFGNNNGSISFYNYTSGNIFNNVFQSVNNRPLGDVVQSITRSSGSTYICVNVSNKIEVVNSVSFAEEATITGVTQPRYMATNGTTGYVSCWGNGGEINMINLLTNTVTGSIPTGSGPERVTISNNNLYVANSGGYGTDSTVTVIDLATNTVTATIDIGAYNPGAIVNGSNNNIWVLAKGKVIYDMNWSIIGHEPSKVIEINTSTNTISSTTLLLAQAHPSNLQISADGSTLYFGGSFGFPGIYTMSTSAPSTPTGLFINEVNYGFFVNASNGYIYILKDASSASGKLIIYNAEGGKTKEVSVGIFPNGGIS